MCFYPARPSARFLGTGKTNSCKRTSLSEGYDQKGANLEPLCLQKRLGRVGEPHFFDRSTVTFTQVAEGWDFRETNLSRAFCWAAVQSCAGERHSGEATAELGPFGLSSVGVSRKGRLSMSLGFPFKNTPKKRRTAHKGHVPGCQQNPRNPRQVPSITFMWTRSGSTAPDQRHRCPFGLPLNTNPKWVHHWNSFSKEPLSKSTRSLAYILSSVSSLKLCTGVFFQFDPLRNFKLGLKLLHNDIHLRHRQVCTMQSYKFYTDVNK